MAKSRGRAEIENDLEAFFGPYRSRMSATFGGCCGVVSLGAVGLPALFYMAGGDSFWSALLKGLVSWLICSAVLFVLIMVYQDAIGGRAVAAFNRAFPFGSPDREVAIEILRQRAARSETGGDPGTAAKSLLKELGVPEEGDLPDKPPEQAIAAALTQLAGDQEPTAEPVPIAEKPAAPPPAGTPRAPRPAPSYIPLQPEPLAGSETDEEPE